MLSPVELGIIVVIVLLFVGSSKLPKLGRAFGRLPGEFERGRDETDPEDQ